MTKKYIFVRMNVNDYTRIKHKKENLKKDMERILGKEIKFSFPQFFNAVANGVIEIEPENAVRLIKVKRFKL